MPAPEQANGLLPSAREIIIEPRRGSLDWRELWEYRDLLALLVRRDFLAKYKQTLLGPLWFILQPLLMALVLSIAFHKVAGVSTGGIPPFLFNLCALLPWTFFAQNVTTGAGTFSNNAHLFGKVYFPRLIVPCSAVISNLFALALQFFVFLVFFAFFALQGASVSIGWNALLALPLMMISAMLSLGVSLLIAASTARLRDLAHLTPVLLQLWLFASPVFFPMGLLTSNPTWSWLAWANPMAPVVEGTRVALLNAGPWTEQLTQMTLTAFAVSLGILFCGVAAFNRAERTVVDTV